MRWYLSDRNRMAEVEAIVVENNVAAHVLERAKATPKHVPFDELMAG
jgi:trigger factor